MKKNKINDKTEKIMDLGLFINRIIQLVRRILRKIIKMVKTIHFSIICYKKIQKKNQIKILDLLYKKIIKVQTHHLDTKSLLFHHRLNFNFHVLTINRCLKTKSVKIQSFKIVFIYWKKNYSKLILFTLKHYRNPIFIKIL